MRFCFLPVLISIVLACGKSNGPKPPPKKSSLAKVSKKSPPPTPPKLQPITAKPGTLLWEFATGKSEWGVQSTPAIGPDGTVYFGADNSKVYALDGKTGAKNWEFNTGGAVHSSPAIGVLSGSPSTPALGSNGTVYVGSYGKKIYAITGDVLNSSPVIGPNGLLCIGSSFPGNKIYAFATRSNGPAKSPWPMRGQNPQHTARAPKVK